MMIQILSFFILGSKRAEECIDFKKENFYFCFFFKYAITFYIETLKVHVFQSINRKLNILGWYFSFFR